MITAFNRRRTRNRRGTSLIEAMMAMVVVLIGLTGLLSAQTVVAKTNLYTQRIRQASALAADLEENIRRWGYNDVRLDNGIAITSLSDSLIALKSDMGTYAAASSASLATFAEQATDPNAATSSATTLGTSVFQGLNPDYNNDGDVDFFRYWTVFDVTISGGSVPDGKLVQTIVRWKEPGFGYRQVQSSTFIVNPAAAAQ